MQVVENWQCCNSECLIGHFWIILDPCHSSRHFHSFPGVIKFLHFFSKFSFIAFSRACECGWVWVSACECVWVRVSACKCGWVCTCVWLCVCDHERLKWRLQIIRFQPPTIFFPFGDEASKIIFSECIKQKNENQASKFRIKAFRENFFYKFFFAGPGGKPAKF